MEFIWLPPFRDCFVLSSGNKQKTGGIRTPPAEDFYEVFKYAKADAALAASLFHYNQLEILELKDYLRSKKIDVRE